MKNIKKILALVLVAVFAIGMLAACGGADNGGGDAPAPAGSGQSLTWNCPSWTQGCPV